VKSSPYLQMTDALAGASCAMPCSLMQSATLVLAGPTSLDPVVIMACAPHSLRFKSMAKHGVQPVPDVETTCELRSCPWHGMT